ncbi:MAG: hypothetical protein HOI53_08690, partial [Francisellaceae bacterium]|nr:hypothetical protein [Francisellaceae bacterium]
SLSLYEMTRDSLARCQKKTSYASSPQHSRCSFTTNPFAILDMDEESLPATERTRQQQQRIT